GEISRLDYNLALVELGRSRSRVLAERRLMQQVTIELARLAGLTSGTPIVPLLDSTQHPPLADTGRARPRDLLAVRRMQLLDIDSLTALAVAQRPDLSERVAALQQANAQVSVARREGFPNVLIRGVSEADATGSGRALRPGVGLTLPIFNRNQGELASRQAAARQAELDRVALMSRLRADVGSAAATYQSAAAEVEALEETELVPARQNRQLLEVAYREGEVGLPVLLLIRNQVIDAELAYWSAWLAEREARATLDEATGANIRDVPNAPPGSAANGGTGEVR
ncbi:MAG: TolC family protein, partial [Gemmatimonadaceae bacterium]